MAASSRMSVSRYSEPRTKPPSSRSRRACNENAGRSAGPVALSVYVPTSPHRGTPSRVATWRALPARAAHAVATTAANTANGPRADRTASTTNQVKQRQADESERHGDPDDHVVGVPPDLAELVPRTQRREFRREPPTLNRAPEAGGSPPEDGTIEEGAPRVTAMRRTDRSPREPARSAALSVPGTNERRYAEGQHGRRRTRRTR